MQMSPYEFVLWITIHQHSYGSPSNQEIMLSVSIPAISRVRNDQPRKIYQNGFGIVLCMSAAKWMSSRRVNPDLHTPRLYII
jgi:hypothetical protein